MQNKNSKERKKNLLMKEIFDNAPEEIIPIKRKKTTDSELQQTQMNFYNCSVENRRQRHNYSKTAQTQFRTFI